MTKNRKLFEEIDDSSNNTQSAPIDDSWDKKNLAKYLALDIIVSLISLILVGGWTRLTDSVYLLWSGSL